MIWINFLHFYQPANIDSFYIKEATKMCYQRVAAALQKNPHIRFTININGSLLMRWDELGYHELINQYKNLIEAGQVELTGTACYHPLLPLVPQEEIIKQVQENEKQIEKYFGKNSKPRGFFLPEMAYSVETGRLIKSLGYEWIILDEIAHQGELGKTKTDQVYKDSSTGLQVVFRSRKYSNTYVPETILKNLESDKTIVTATDGEIYGLRHIDHDKKFEDLLQIKSLNTKTISEFIDSLPTAVATDCQSCCWDSTAKELKEGLPFVLWSDPKNTIHEKLWEIANFTHDTVQKYQRDQDGGWARWHLVRGLASCTFWWASDRDFSQIYGPKAWNPDEVIKGINELTRAIRSIGDPQSLKEKIKIEKLATDLVYLIWEKHWKKHWNK